MALRWNTKLSQTIESPEAIEMFLDAIVNVYRIHSMTLSHEDHHGAFCIEGLDENNIGWLRDAFDRR